VCKAALLRLIKEDIATQLGPRRTVGGDNCRTASDQATVDFRGCSKREGMTFTEYVLAQRLARAPQAC